MGYDMPNQTETRTPPSVHYTTIEGKIPEWLKAAPAETHQSLRNWKQAPAWLTAAIQEQPTVAKAWSDEHARHRENQAQVRKLFEHIPDLTAFARKVLSNAIEQRFGLTVDVDNTFLLDARLIDTASSIDARQAIDRATRSLLRCAMNNFDATAAVNNGMDAADGLLHKSVILDHRRFMGTVPITNALDIHAEDFADLCRTLDIGGKYHDMLHTIYYPAAEPGQSADENALTVYQTLGRAEASAFRQSLHFAFLKGDISEVLYTAALATPLETELPAPAASNITFSLVTLWEVELAGIALITCKIAGQNSVALYTPDDSTTPIKEFVSVDALKADLRNRLLADISYLETYIADRDKGSVSTRLKNRLTPIEWSIRGLQERNPDPHATLNPVMRPFRYSFLSVMAFQKVERHERDVVFHAVPTYVVDLRTAKAHRELIAGRVLTALNIAGFFVPGLGEAMLAVYVVQLAHEVYEGIESWENDEKDQAYGYLVDVVENVAIMAAFAAAASAIKDGVEVIKEPPAEKPMPVEAPSFIEELEDVELPNGETRLWKPDLVPYRHAQVLPEELEPDEVGLRHHQGKRWLLLQDNQYVVKQAPSTGEYHLEHPSRTLAHEPVLRHNGAGAWLLPFEQPLQWPLNTLLQRMGAPLTDEEALQALRVSDTHEDILRRALTESQRLPAMLQDSMARFKLDRIVRQLPDADGQPAEFERAYARLPASQAPGAKVIQRVYPTLPAAVTDELIDNASLHERQTLSAGKVPLRLAEEIRVYQQQIRLNRAYEGLYLTGVRSWDTDRLTLHTLEQLPDWPTQTKLELLQNRRWPSQRASIGILNAQPYKTITSAEVGYIVHDELQADAAVTAHSNLYAALYEALPEVMAQLGCVNADELRRLVQESPLLPRSSLRQVLGMQPVRPGYRSPMRLADGRLGYPLSGGMPAEQGITRQALLDAVAATGLTEHTPRSVDQIMMILANPGRTRLQVLERLQELLEQRNELQSRLDDWNEAFSPSDDQAARDHDNLRNAIMQHWYDTALVEHAEHTAELNLERVPLADIPLTLPASFTSRVRTLRLLDLAPGTLAGWAQHERLLQRLFRQMPQLETLEISRAYDPRATPSSSIFSIPTITQHLPALHTLAFTNQNIPLSSSDLNLLAGLRQLRHLDLSGNRFAQHHSPGFHELSLDYLGLDHMQLSQWPIGLGSEALGRITRLSLRNNNLRTLPSFLLSEPDTLPNQFILSLEGNAFNETQLQRLLLNERRSTTRFNVDQSPALTEQLEQIRRERQQMRDAIDGWAHASSSSAPLTQEILADRQRIESALTEFWNRQERGLPHLWLRLEDVALENFPRRLPAFFGERVNALTLTRLRGSTSQLDELLRRFPNITRLTIDAHVAPMPSLPSVLARLPRLTDLELRNMDLEIDQATLDILGELQQLTSLDLSGNRLGVISQVPENLSLNLTTLALTNMNLQGWPSWCDRLLPLEFLDLSSNNITQLPDHILHNINNPMPISSISLFDNPLSVETVQRVRTFSDSQHSYSFALDLPDNLMLVDSSDEGSLLGHPHFPIPYSGDDTPRLEDWMLGTEAQNEALRDSWERIQTLEDGSNLFHLVGRLRNAGPYLDPTSQASFSERVRMVLITAASNDAERPTMNAIAAAGVPDPLTGSQTCHDGALQEFNNIELYLMGKRVLTDAGDTLKSLHRRLRQLYRTGQLDLLAHQRSDPGDLVSVRLAYRRSLAKELDLPIADSMRFRSAAQLRPDELTRVLNTIRERESSDAFINYLLANEDWTRRLRAEHSDRFAEIEQDFGARVLAAAALDVTLEEELALQERLHKNKDQQEMELLRALTNDYSRDN
ncbi:dermonecrotic toxin domain-containing protein [Pseudomonas sp. GZD-222]|uniref:dermonecrotic toxin domain-containing protein n=1 Tax=Pseudomonas sp. GZD-222 TaxID=3404805 RepID=UPI003BB7BFDD